MRDEPKSVLENVARLERENAELAARIEQARAAAKMEETIQTRPRAETNHVKPSTVKVAAAVSLGIAFGLVTLAVTLLLVPPVADGHVRDHHRDHDLRGGSAGVCR
jgi:hypothetical protein